MAGFTPKRLYRGCHHLDSSQVTTCTDADTYYKIGGADQDSGTPVAGTTNVIIGNNDGQTRTFDGLINKLTVIEGILDIDTITQYWSESLKHIK